MPEVVVVGAGMAGLLAANMLGGDLECIIEKQPSLPNNHSAVLRFRSSHVGDVLNIPFKKVRMLKATQPWRNPVADALAYSFKTTGTSLIRSSAAATGEIEERYVAPENLIERMNNKIPPDKFKFKSELSSIDIGSNPIISTMPMPSLMSLLMYPYPPKDSFKSQRGYTIFFTIEDCDAYCSLYIPEPSSQIWRISITGNKCMVETNDLATFEDRHDLVREALEFLGMDFDRANEPVMKLNTYAKILPIDETDRKRFIIWASEKHNIYSFGRFATWRPGLLMDDLINDFRVIMRLIEGGTKYDHVKGG